MLTRTHDATGVVTSSQDSLQPTQQATQATQQAVPQPLYNVDPNIWGSLVPYTETGLPTITFQRWKRTYQFGRSPAEDNGNDVTLSGLLINRK